MSTVAIYNGFGGYETNDKGEKGITLQHCGIPFWMPFQKNCYIPDFTMREVDHNASTADKEEESVLTYKTFLIKGERIAEELLETQIPYPNSSKGFIIVRPSNADKVAGNYEQVLAGYSEDGTKLYTEVLTFEASEEDRAYAAKKAAVYKETLIKEYFQSKRERMAGGKGKIMATGLLVTFMEELGVKDIDDVSEQLKRAAGMAQAQPTDGNMDKLLGLLTQLLQGTIPAKPSVAEPISTPEPAKAPVSTPKRGAPAAGLV